MKKNVLLILLLAYGSSLWAQTTTAHSQSVPGDSIESRPMQEVVVKAYEQNRKLSEVGAPISIIGKNTLNRFGNTSIVSAVNTAPGVRMEERSPGSYRLNIRGSSLRSLFGVRDIKIYWNEIPLTDPGGNTYLNQLGFYNFQGLEIIKGAAGSLYGAGIGGAVLIHSMPGVWQPGANVDYITGSFATNSLNFNIRTGDNEHRNDFSYTHQTSNGYRVQSQMRRDIGSWETLLKASDKQILHAYILYGDLYYQTPGALTLTQYNLNPKAARYALGTSPSAVQAQAAIFQKNFTAGFSQEYHFSPHFQNTTAVYGAYTDFTNPGIRVYERRQEPHFGGRTVFQYTDRIGETHLQLNAGAEGQRGFFETRDYANSLGVQGALQTDDHIGNWQYMIFAQADLSFRGGWILTGGASLNESSYQITRLSVLPPTPHTVNFNNKVTPRIALLKKVLPEISVYASASRGFSTPTVAEVEKSNGIIGPPLQPEDGIDYELGARGSLFHGRLFFDVDAFVFHIRNYIVQRIDSTGVSYSVNAGGTDQHGIETYVSYQLVDQPQQFFTSVKLFVSHTWHDFHYSSFIQDTSNYSNHRLPSVPPQTIVGGVDIAIRPGFYTNWTFTYADKIALNDANTSYAGSYNLLGGRVGYRKTVKGKYRLDLFAGADNLFNTKYSLGNDINAAAGLYYNAAPGVNYFAGLSIGWLSR